MQQLETKTVYQNAWMTVREDRVARSDGTTGTYGVVDKADFALTIPRERGGAWLVEQYRYPIGRRAWEFPQGSWPGAPGGDQVALAMSELREETGLVAEEVVHLGHLFGAYGFCSQGFDVFLATGLVAGQPDREHTEQDMVHRFVTDAQLAKMISTGDVVDAATIAAYALLLLWEPLHASPPNCAGARHEHA
jgi:8-oxo-dGTP pyrophosphatase MutT (NUDIX family)